MKSARETASIASRESVHYAWVVLGCLTVFLMVASGVRASFGVFIKPMEAEFGWARTTLSAVAALSLFLYGAVAPLVGRLADRWGSRSVLVLAAVLLGVGMLGTAAVNQLWQLFLTVGILAALGGGGGGMPVASSVAARWFEARRGLVLGIAGGGLGTGQLLIVPLAMAFTLWLGWRTSFIVLGLGVLLLVLPLVLTFVRNDPEDLGLAPYGAAQGAPQKTATRVAAERTPLFEAIRSGPFWLLAGSFWVCGYTTSGLVLTHLIPFALERGFDASQAAQALGVMGVFNIVGTIASGWLCDRFGQKGFLAGYYFLRGLSLLFLPYIESVPGFFVFAVIFGLNYISTVPPTNGLTAKIYGRYSVGELSGWIFLSHQVGAAFGALIGGYLYDYLGDYTIAFHSAALLALAAAALVLAITDQPVVKGSSRPETSLSPARL